MRAWNKCAVTWIAVASTLMIVIVNLFFVFKSDSEETSVASFVSFRTVARSCSVGVGVFSKASNSMQRDVVRQTWGKLAMIPGVNFYFVIASRGISISPHEAIQFQRERKTENDILFVDVYESEEGSYSKSLAWFTWIADMTTCELAFKTEDTSYVRVPTLMNFISSKVRAQDSTKTYFGMQIGSWESEIPYMSRIGYGISREVAIWISKNKYLPVSSQQDDLAIGVLLSYLRNTTGLEYITDSEAFGGDCTQESVLDSPVLSHDFNMYVRFHDDTAGKFCEHVLRSATISSTHLRHVESPFSYEALLRSNLSVTEDTHAPWNRANRRHYADIKDYTHALSNYASKNWFPWFAVTDTALYGGAAVLQKLDPSEKAMRSLVLERAARVFRSIFPTCTNHKVVGVWLKNWGSRKEYVANLLCMDKGPAAANQALVHVPFLANGGMDPHSPAHVVGSSSLAAITPITCRLDTLKRYLSTSGLELGKVPGRKKRIVLAWSYCQDAESNFTEPQLLEVVDDFKKKEATVEVELLFFQDGKLFSRSKALNAAILACRDDDLVVIVDVDLYVKVDFFLNALAFARQGHSMYFPIMFSRFNPDLINMYTETLKLSTGPWLSKPETITADTGLWRDFSLGMVGMYASDAKAVGLFDAEIEGWGNEDVFFFEKCQAAGYMNFRPYDLKEIHLYHPKECEELRGGDRYEMCLGSKLRLEGTQLQVAVALHRRTEEQNSSPASATDKASKAPAPAAAAVAGVKG